ncbi:hypothetical protein N1031_04815 [Herbiconiux moechotypicola]|nr:hypothetical protein [Herbiconiux moechotypicola]MCS5729074.1 hypothetical protein [Herbiconiux moechotypicola]
MADSSEAALIAEAEGLLGDGEKVVAAGHFGLASLRGAHLAGGVVGGLAGAVAVDDVLSGALGAGLGGLAATHSAAEAQGVTVKMLVAVTADTIHLLNRDTGGRLQTVVASFPRSTTTATVSKVGLSRILTLTEPASGATVELHGSVSWLSAQSAGDKVVLGLLEG